MKKTFMALVLLVGTAFAVGWVDYETCEPQGATYKCLAPTLVSSIPITFVEDLTCYSSRNTTCETDCEGIIDKGCFSMVQPDHDLAITLNYDIIDNATGETLSKTTETRNVPRADDVAYEVMVDPEAVDFSRCTKGYELGFYAITCPYNGKHITFDGGILVGEGDPAFVVITVTKEGAGFDIGSFISANWVYLLLGIILIAVVIWAFKPRQEKSAGPGFLSEPPLVMPRKPRQRRR